MTQGAAPETRTSVSDGSGMTDFPHTVSHCSAGEAVCRVEAVTSSC